MRSKKFQKALSVLLAAAIAASCMSTGLSAIAAGRDEKPPQGEKATGKAQPRFPGYRLKDIQNWSPATDPYADMLRARVPLQKRNEQYQPTQANPTLTDDAKVMLMQGDYHGMPFDNTMYNNDFSQYTFNYWQYTDMWSPWHGAASAATPSSFQGMDFEYATINIPNAAYTNAAHKNGVMSIACMYFDGNNRKGQSINEMLDRDDEGNFLIVDKLVEMAEYYGYDGYFLNQEESTSEEAGGDAALQELMSQLTARGMYTQYYTAGQRSIDNSRIPWLTNSEGKTVCNSIFTDYVNGGNYEWYDPDPSVTWCKNNGYNIYDVGFFGLECTRGGLNVHPGNHAFIEGTRNLKASIALFTPVDQYRKKLIFNDDNPDLPAYQQARFQWMVDARERFFFSGAKHDPTDTEFEGTVDWSSVGAGDVSARGVAQYISERSVIDGSTFYTNFNTGRGMQYFVDGAVSRDEEWSNINIQDILPSWQWWMDTDGTRLSVDFDYGTKDERADVNSQPLDMPYTQVGAYDGGSSLVVYGDIDAKNTLHLYKTDLQVKEDSSLSITYNKVSESDSSVMEIGLIFKNASDGSMYTIEVPDSGRQTDGWVTKTLSIDPQYAGEEIAAICLVFQGENGVKDYQMNIGGLRLTDGGSHTPAAPTGLNIRAAYDTKEMILEWDLADYDQVDKYNVYANMTNGGKVCMGGVYDGVYYIKNMNAKDIVSLEVTAVGKDGSESEPAAIEYSYSDNVSNLKVAESLDANGRTMQAAHAGYLDVSFTKPSVEYTQLRLDVKLVDVAEDASYSMTVGNDADSARFYIPRGRGETYDLYVTTVFADGSESKPVAYRGQLRDVWSQPIDEKDVQISYNKVGFISPASVDWYKLYAYANGEKFFEGTRGADVIQYKRDIPEGATTVDVILEDYSGNLSEPLTVSVSKYTKSVGKLDATTVPDAVLRQAIIEQIGSDTISAAKAFTGKLDLSGLEIHDLIGLGLVSRASEIDLSGTPIEIVPAGAFGFYVQKVDLSNCDKLKIVDPAAFEGTVALREVNITGCAALELLAITDSSVEKLVYGSADAFPNLVRMDLSGSRFDLSEGTPERAFVEQIRTQVSDDKSVGVIDPNITNLGPGATFVAEQSTVTASKAATLFDGDKSINNTFSTPAVIVMDLGAEQTVTGWTLTNGDIGGFSDFDISTSIDGVNYEVMHSISGNKAKEVSGTADAPVKARYIKLHAYDSYGWSTALKEWEIFGNKVVAYPSELIYDSQRPRMLPELETTIDIQKNDGATFDLAQALADAKEEAAKAPKTVRGTAMEALAGADFLDPNYELAAEYDAREVHVIEVTDRDGNLHHDQVLDASKDNEYTVHYVTYDSANLEGETLYTFTVKVAGTETDTSALEAVIAEAESLDENDYTAESWAAMQAKLDNAVDVLADDAATQQAIDDAKDALRAAIDALESKPVEGAPVISSSIEDGGFWRASVRLTADKTVTWTVNGVELPRKGANLVLGDAGFYTVSATDAEGRVSNTLTFTIDKERPVLSSEQVEANGMSNQDVVVKADEDVRFELDGVAIEGYSKELTVTGSGRHVVKAYDRAGNYSGVFVFTIEQNPPVLSTNFFILNGVTRYNVAVTADRRVDYYVNGELVAENEYRCKFLEPGVYEVKAVDAAGNESKTLKFEIRR